MMITKIFAREKRQRTKRTVTVKGLMYFKMWFIPVMAKLNFLHSLLQSSVSFLLCYKKYNINKVLNIFVETLIHFFRILWWIDSSKEQHLFERNLLDRLLILIILICPCWIKVLISYLLTVLKLLNINYKTN